MAEVIMIQGTMSGVGKSLLTAGLLRILKRDGYRAAPFKSQNMALNSYITQEGLEIGRAQAMQAEAAGIRPLACMNPILLKPTSHTGSQVIVNGQAVGSMSAKEYFSYKQKLIPDIRRAFRKLEACSDVIVIEGAGSPAEINLREQDIVNMGLAEMLDAPVLLAGDIDRGGVFAQLLGTLMLLEKEEKQRVKGLVINKFRGDRSLLETGIQMLEEKGGVPVLGVIPYMEIALEDEDSLTGRFQKREKGIIDIAVIRYPRISNFTDFNVFEQLPGVSLRYVDTAARLGCPDMIFLPGSKNTIDDLRWMRRNGLEQAVKEMAREIPVCGICGGCQMLGMQICDPLGLEEGGAETGMGLLAVTTELQREKVRRQAHGTIGRLDGVFSVLCGRAYAGYEIHMGRTARCGRKPESKACPADGPQAVFLSGKNENVYGTYVHGIFDKDGAAYALVEALAQKKGGGAREKMEELRNTMQEKQNFKIYDDYAQFKEMQYDKLADTLAEYLDMEAVYGILREAHLES